ncbi:MAG TPA: hypothetical protein VLL08_13450 [Kineosporiaceae bacterium]|nr:hypothetical protein [Kineosporiaceae bacterium]
MRRLRPVLIGVLIIADLAILLGTPFLETVGHVPRRLGYTFEHFDTDPAATALPLVRVLLGAVLMAAIVDQTRGFLRRPPPSPPAEPAPDPPGWTAVRQPEQTANLMPVAVAVRDRWHDLPAWTWVGPIGVPDVQVGEAIWRIARFTVTVEAGIDFDQALRRIEVHDAFRQFADDADDFERRRAVVMALSAGQHWPFLGRSSFHLALTRITAAEVSALDGVFVLRTHAEQNGSDSGAQSNGLAYLVAPTTTATTLVENDPDLVVALADHLDPPTPEVKDGYQLHQRLAAAVARVASAEATGPGAGRSLSPPSQEAVFRIQRADSLHRARANTRDQRFIVSVARIDRIYYSTQTASEIPVGGFRQVTAEGEPDR